MPSAGTEAEVCGCPICVSAAENGAAYFARAFGAQRNISLTAESIADALGFCRRHGARVLTHTELVPAIGQVFRDVVGRIGPMVAEDYARGDQFWQTFFGARDACPACAHEQRAVSRHAGQLARSYANSVDAPASSTLACVCVAHLRRIAEELSPELRMPFLAHCIDKMNNAERFLEESLTDYADCGAETRENREREIQRSFNLAGGYGNATAILRGASSSGECSYHTLACHDPDSDHCPVCAEIERTRCRWMQSVQDAERHHIEGWLLFPTCPDHVATISSLGDRKLTCAVMSNALRGAIGQVQYEIRRLIRAAETQEEFPAVRIAPWGKRRRRKSPGPKLVAPRPDECPACERIVLAEARAVGNLLDALTREKYRDDYRRGYGLCMKHFAQAGLVAPRGAVRNTLCAHQQARLTEDALAFDEIARTSKTSANDALQAPRYRSALHRICGFAGADALSLHAQPP